MADDDALRKNWQRMLDGLKQAGDAVEAQLAGKSEAERADAYRAVMRALTANLGKAEADGRYPLPVHVNPPNQKWFIDNPDGITVHCPLDDTQRYRLWGNLGAACYTSFTLYEGKGDGLATKAVAVRTDREIPVQADGSFSLTLSAPLSTQQSSDPAHLTLAPGTGQLWIRQLFNDIDHEAPGWFMIENLAPAAPPPAVSVEAVTGGMKRIARGLPLLTQMMFGAYRMQTGQHPANSVRVWTEMQNGAFFTSNDIDYFIGAWQLENDRQLVIRGQLPDCRHWNIVLYSPVLNSLEHRYRRTSLTGAQLQCDARGHYEITLAHARPAGAANWLDTEGRPAGLFVIRVTGAASKPALPAAATAPFHEAPGP